MAGGKFLAIGYANPVSYITARVLTREEESVDEGFRRKRLKKALDFRRKISVSALDAYRLAFSEADFLPGLIVDKFGDYIAMQVLTLGVERVKDTIVKILIELFPVKGVYQSSYTTGLR